MNTLKNKKVLFGGRDMGDLILLFLLFSPLLGLMAGNGVSTSDPVREKAVLWEVSGNGLEKSSYLFGTYHLIKGSHLGNVRHAEALLEAADGVVVEIVMDSAEMVSIGMQMIMPDNSLKNLLSKKEYKQLEKFWEQRTGQPLGMFNQMKPMALGLQLIDPSGLEGAPVELLEPGLPLDMHIVEKAKNMNKPVQPLETIAEQMEFLLGAPLEDQAKDLMETIDMIDEVDKNSLALCRLYLEQDLPGIVKLSEEGDDMPSNSLDMTELLDGRNNKWMEQLPDLMAEGSQFIAVGTLHLVGETGLIRQLRAQGYNVTPVIN